MEIGHNKLCEFVRITVKNNMRNCTVKLGNKQALHFPLYDILS